MKKILLFAMSILVFNVSVNAQRKLAVPHSNSPAHRICGTPELPHEYEEWLSEKIAERNKLGSANKTAVVYNLPVVIHVIHNGTNVGNGFNISLAQIQSQLDVLNEDYRKLNADTNLIPSVFKPVLADAEINFCLAQQDPNGAPTTGIDRINRTTQSWSTVTLPYSQTDFNTSIKPATIWNPNKYLNIWVAPLSGGILGYATFPAASTLQGLTSNFGTLTSDGVVIQYNAFGRVGNLDPVYNKGRTATHEVGHWLGLRHVWGDSNCGTDFVTDTPTQQTANFGCPSFPSVTCSNGPNGDMFMNYMDYTDDPCMFMFTAGQKVRMQTVMANSPFRVALATSNACSPPVVAAPVAAFTSNTTSIPVGGSVNFIDQSTNAPSSWAWTFQGGNPASSTSQNPTGISYATAGVFDVTLTATNASGSNTLTKNGYIVVTQGGTSGCDTISNFDFATFTPLVGGSGLWGYISGHNDYLDVGKADKYAITGANKEIDGAYFVFGVGSSSGTGQTVSFKVWNENTTTGLPNTAIGNSTIVSYDSIAAYAAAGAPMWVDFTPNIPVSGNVFVGVEFGYTAGDTLAIYHCNDGEIAVGTAYELWDGGLDWHAFSETPASWGVNVALAIVPVICTATGINENNELSDLSIYPNPSRGELNIQINEQLSRKEVEFSVMNIFGSKIYSTTLNANNAGKYQLQLNDLAAGFYFLDITTGDSHRIEKFQITK